MEKTDNILLLSFDDNKIKMARKSGKIEKENSVRCTGEVEIWDNIRREPFWSWVSAWVRTVMMCYDGMLEYYDQNVRFSFFLLIMVKKAKRAFLVHISSWQGLDHGCLIYIRMIILELFHVILTKFMRITNKYYQYSTLFIQSTMLKMSELCINLFVLFVLGTYKILLFFKINEKLWKQSRIHSSVKINILFLRYRLIHKYHL